MKKDVVIVGGGAAGLMCAVEAGRRGRSVTVLEKSERVGKKILISGGGRCNFTNVNAGPENYVSRNPHFCKSALARYTPADFVSLVEKHGIRYHEKKLGQLFCDISSKQIVDMLENECRKASVQILTQTEILGTEKHAEFRLQTSRGPIECDSLVIASGGLSFPKLGAGDFGHRLAERFGLKLTERRPGLVPLTIGSAFSCDPLSGLSIDVTATRDGTSFRENMLFTHRGLSGPAILQISNYWKPGESIAIDLLPGRSASELLLAERRESKELTTVLSQVLPRRFVVEFCEKFAPSRPMRKYTPTELERLAGLLHHWEVQPVGTEGYAKAEVTLGGVDTDELSSKTMESRKAPGLYFVGEVVDVTGWLGGYNFQWAWASGFVAGQYA